METTLAFVKLFIGDDTGMECSTSTSSFGSGHYKSLTWLGRDWRAGESFLTRLGPVKLLI